MGANLTAFAFGEEPDWNAIAGTKMALQGYAHKQKSVWLMAVSAHKINNYDPFSAAVGAKVNKTYLKKLDDETKAVVEKLVEFETDLGRFGALSVPFIAHAAEVSQLAGVPTYYFSGDDEGRDLGISFAGKKISFALRVSETPLAVVMKSGKYSVLIDQKELDGEFSQTTLYEPVVDALEKWRNSDWISVKKASSKQLELQNQFFGFAADQWPNKWGDPATLAGVGTWDFQQILERDYQMVVERKSTTGSLARKRVSKK